MLNYQELVTGYYDNLNNNLRNFKGGPGFLETWVHDEDHNRSLLEILDLAHSHAIAEMTIQLPAEVVASLNMDWLSKNAAEYGTLELAGGDLKFSNAKSSLALDEFAGLSETYVEAVKQQSRALTHDGFAQGHEVLSSSLGEGRLTVAIDEKGLVTQAKHAGFKGAERAVMDRFCSQLERRSLQEGFEHGAIRTEVSLRDPSKPPKVKGLVTADTADPVFHTPIKLIREIWKNYVNAKGEKPGRNFWRDPVPGAWLALEVPEKMKRAQIALTECGREFGLQPDVLVTNVLNDTRFVLSYKQAADKPDFGRHMIKLERKLREKFGFEVELQLESIEDRNRREERTKR